MKNLLAGVLTSALLFIPLSAQAATRPPAVRPPAAVQITKLTETCGAAGYTWLTLDVTVNKAGSYEIYLRDDSDRLQDQDQAVDATGEYEVSIPYPQQEDLILKNAAGATVAERSVAAVSVCSTGW